MIPIPPITYLFIFYLLLFLIPIGLSVEAPSPGGNLFWLIIAVINFVIFALTHYCTKSEGLTLNYGLIEICESGQSGCANITFVYMVPLLFIAYLLAVVATFRSFFKGRRFSQERWIAIVSKLGPGVQYGPIVNAISDELAKSPNRPDLYLRRAEEYEKCGLYELAIADYDKVLSFQYSNADVLFRKGRICEELGRIREAIIAYNLFMQFGSKEDKERRALVQEWLTALEDQSD